MTSGGRSAIGMLTAVGMVGGRLPPSRSKSSELLSWAASPLIIHITAQ